MWQTLSHLASLSSILWSRQDHGTNVPEVGSRMQPTMDKKHPAPEIVLCVGFEPPLVLAEPKVFRSTSSPAQGSWLHTSLSSWEFSMPESVPTQPGCRGLCKVEGPQGQPPERDMASWFLETWLIVINCLWNYFLKNAWLRWLAFALDSVLLQILINHQGLSPGFPSICWYLTDPAGAAAKDETLGVWQGPDEDDKSLVLWYEHLGGWTFYPLNSLAISGSVKKSGREMLKDSLGCPKFWNWL